MGCNNHDAFLTGLDIYDTSRFFVSGRLVWEFEIGDFDLACIALHTIPQSKAERPRTHDDGSVPRQETTRCMSWGMMAPSPRRPAAHWMLASVLLFCVYSGDSGAARHCKYLFFCPRTLISSISTHVTGPMRAVSWRVARGLGRENLGPGTTTTTNTPRPAHQHNTGTTLPYRIASSKHDSILFATTEE